MGIARTCALEDLYASFRDKLRGFVASRTHDDDLANDLVQEAFAKVVAYCQRGGDCAQPKSFLYKITTNVIADHYRRGDLKARLVPVSLEDDRHHGNVMADPPAPDDSQDRDFLACLIPLIESLPEPYRQALKLADMEGIPQHEIARRMGISVSGAKSRIQRGRSKLRDTILSVCSIDHDCYGHVTRCEPRR